MLFVGERRRRRFRWSETLLRGAMAEVATNGSVDAFFFVVLDGVRVKKKE